MTKISKLEIRNTESYQTGVRGFVIQTPKHESGGSFVVARASGPLVGFERKVAAKMVELYNAWAATEESLPSI